MSKPTRLQTVLLAISILFITACSGGPPASSSPSSNKPVQAASPENESPQFGEKWTLVKFGAPWCPPCRQMEPELKKFETHQPQIAVIDVNVDEKDKPPNKELFEKYFQGPSIPYTVLLSEDQSVKRSWTGFKSYQELVTEIRALENEGSQEPVSGEKQ